jgi:hypothetical protein
MGYRITESYPQGGTGIPAGAINYIYYDNNWQAIETRTNGTFNINVISQTIWTAAYINAAVLRDSYLYSDIQPNSRLYYLQNAQWNTTTIVCNFLNKNELFRRCVYSPYGTITILNADWNTPPTGTQPAVDNLCNMIVHRPVL